MSTWDDLSAAHSGKAQERKERDPSAIGHRPSAIRVLLACLGLLLIASGLVKVYAPADGPQDTMGVFSASWVRAVWTGLELAIGAWLLMSRPSFVSRNVALILFAALAGASLARWVANAPSCGCFGALRVSPWVSHLISVVAVGSLTVLGGPSSRTRLSGASNLRHLPAGRVARGLATASMIAFSAASSYVLAGGAIPQLPARDALELDPKSLNFGEAWARSDFEWSLPIRNVGGKELLIDEIRVSSAAVTLLNAPKSIPAYGSVTLRFELDLTKTAGTFADASTRGCPSCDASKRPLAPRHARDRRRATRRGGGAALLASA